MTGTNVQTGLRRAVWLLFLAAFACIFLVIELRGHLNLSVRRLAFCALLAAGAFALRRFLPLVDRLSPGRWRAVFGGGLALLLALQLGSGFLLLQELTTSPFDTEAILRTATELAQGIVPATYNYYFASVDSNVLCMFVLYWMYRPVYLLTGATGPAWAMGLNALCLSIAAVCVCGAAVIFGFNAYKWNCGLLDLSLYDSMHTPTTHWIMMRLENDGAFNNESFAYTGRHSTIEKKRPRTWPASGPIWSICFPVRRVWPGCFSPRRKPTGRTGCAPHPRW